MSDDVPMIDDGSGGGEPAALMAGASVGAGNVSKETQVMKNATPSYGLQETHTTLSLFEGFFSSTSMDFTAPNFMEFRMTSPLDCVATSSLVNVAIAGAYTKAVNNVPWIGTTTGLTRVAGSAEFPIVTATGSVATEIGSWFAFWAKIYEYYTVLSCDYEIIINNPSATPNNDVLVGWDFNSYSDTVGATGNKTPQLSTLMDMKSYKHMKWTKIEATTSLNVAKPISVISGRYLPGMANRNVSNDGDVKTWNKVTDQPTLKEFLTLYFFKHPLSLQNTTTAINRS